MQTRVLLDGLAMPESPRWHDGRLWFSNWGTQQIVAVDVDGDSQVMARVPTNVPFCIDWLPDGRDARQRDADRRGVFRLPALSVRYRTRRQAVEPPDLGEPRESARRHLP